MMGDNDLTLEKLKIVEQLQEISKMQVRMTEQMTNYGRINDAVQKILDRHDLILLGDGSTDHIGVSGRLKSLEDDFDIRKNHTKWIWSAIILSFLEHLRYVFFGGK